MLTLLDQNIEQLVQDARPIRDLFLRIRGHLPETAVEALVPAAYIESQQFEVLKAKQRLADRSRQEQMAKDKESHVARVEDLRRRIDTLRCSRPTIVREIGRLKARKVDLMKELRLIGNAITAEETKLAELPSAIDGLEQEKLQHDQQANWLHKNIQPIPGSADADFKKIEDADQIRLRAIDTICGLLNL
jgi:chromosome segregation ATPase